MGSRTLTTRTPVLCIPQALNRRLSSGLGLLEWALDALDVEKRTAHHEKEAPGSDPLLPRKLEIGDWNLLSLGCPRTRSPGPGRSRALTSSLPARGGGRKRGDAGATESDLSKPPCYEEAVLMAEPPPPYSEVLTDTRGLYRKIVTPFLSRDSSEKQEQPPNYKPLFLDRGYSSALHLSSAPRPGPPCPALYLQAERSRRVFPSWTDSELSNRDPLEHGAWRLPVSIPLFGRTTAV
ncbi:proline-rich protein 7 isoform X3 [Monodelphis domestica]|uniref:proline-rich protein 7 isoform X3 n=1 Tax=Monodelphis domestica TaxID=13616 RepID=UPI0024E1ADE6|nr:proline-rich protein 7 isoform X3 [Monodelphis domestica]